ncbi:DUF3618 domain-containing protein [Halomonas sp. GXIMD04776]|uniref:DUF3618 domain-containing protein n=1 Tax=Halomonas sp. GXIMD04776 TaxID=3415605 RepID=UPI003C9F91B2
MSDNQDNQDTRKPEEIESDIEGNRERLDRTLHELEEKISPQRLIDTTLDYVRSGGANEFASNLSDTIKNNPVPFVLTGVGLGWLMMAQRNPDKYSRRQHHDDVDIHGYEDSRHYPMTTRPAPTGTATGSTRVPPTSSVPSSTSVPPTTGTTAPTTTRVPPAAYTTGAVGDTDYDDRQGKDRMSGAKEKAQHISSGVKGRAQDMSNSMRDGTARMKSGSRSALRGASQGAQNAGQQTTQFIQEHPLVTAALGVAIGAAIGSLLPSTRFENERFGDTRDKLVDRAAEEGQKHADKAQAKVQDKAEQAKQNAPAGSGSQSTPGGSGTPGVSTPGNPSQASPSSPTRPTEQDISRTDMGSGNPPSRGV